MGKPRPVSYEAVGHEDRAYDLLSEVRMDWHDEVADATVVLVWRRDLKPDVDGRLVLGQCVRGSDLQKELALVDFVILLNREAWEHEEFTDEKRRALLDHELCHCAPAMDGDEPKLDERGRRVWRVRKHDVEEFQDVVSRHGLYKRDLERFAEALLARDRPARLPSP